MSRNRAILADIVEFGLNPAKPHTNTHANGRLSKKHNAPDEIASSEDVVEVKNALVEVKNDEKINDVADKHDDLLKVDELVNVSEEKEQTTKKKGKK